MFVPRFKRQSDSEPHDFTVDFSYQVTYEGSIGVRGTLDVADVVDRAHRLLAQLRPEQVHKIANYRVGKIEIGDVVLRNDQPAQRKRRNSPRDRAVNFSLSKAAAALGSTTVNTAAQSFRRARPPSRRGINRFDLAPRDDGMQCQATCAA